MDSSCKNSIVTFISFCTLPYCSGKKKICLSMPFGSSKLLFCDLVLQKFHKATNVSYSRWTTLKNTSANPCLWLILWRLHSFHIRRLHDLTLKFYSCDTNHAKTTQFCYLLINHKLMKMKSFLREIVSK